MTTTSDPASRDIRRLWVDYRNTGNQHLRNELIERYMHLVRYNAERIHMRLPGEVDIEDLVSAGVFGLMDAVRAYNIHRGVKFETYCAPRIRGAILDELRAMDWVPRLVRSRSSKVRAAMQTLENETGETPSDRQVARRLNVSMPEYHRMVRDSKRVDVVSLSRKWFETDSSRDVREIDMLVDQQTQNPFVAVARKEAMDRILLGLARDERMIINLYYFENMRMKETGQAIGMSESRVSQKHTVILSRLKSQFTEEQLGDLLTKAA